MPREVSPPGGDDQIRCPRLGHQVPFLYCRRESKGLPCFKILDCWYDHFLVEDYLRSELSPQEWEILLHGHPKPKMLTLVELIEQAKRNRDG